MLAVLIVKMPAKGWPRWGHAFQGDCSTAAMPYRVRSYFNHEYVRYAQ